MNGIKKLIQAINRFQQRHSFIAFPYALIKKYGDDEGGNQAALLTYYGFLSLFPLLIVLTSILQLVLRNNEAVRDDILKSATDYFPVIGNQLQSGVTGSVTGTGIALIVGIVLTLFGARGDADAFRSTVNNIWQIPYARRSGFPKAPLKSLSIIVVSGFGLLLAPALSGYAATLGHNPALTALSLLITVTILFGVFVFAIKMSVEIKKTLGAIWVSALVASIGLMAVQALGSYLLKKQLDSLDSVYGTFAIVLGLLYWLYLQAQIIVYALEVDTVRTLKLWPRSLDTDNLTDADKHAYTLYAQKNRFQPEEAVDVDFDRKP